MSSVHRTRSLKLDPIPVRILELAALAKPEFHELLVWHPSTGAQTDPVLVGKRTSDWGSPLYLLGRWGEVLENFSVLRQKAAKLIRRQLNHTLSKEISDRQFTLSQLKAIDDATLISTYTGTSWSPLG